MIGTLHAFKWVSSGGIDSMQLQESYFGNEQYPERHVREHYAEELQEVVSRHLPMFYRRAHRYVGDKHDAEDAVQDALLSAYKHLDQFKATAQMTTWLTTIVTNCALSQLRKKPRHLHVSLDEPLAEDQDYFVSDRLADVRPSPEKECISSDLHGHLMRFLNELSPALRRVIQLRVIEGLTTSEVANILGVSCGTVKAQASRARTKLKQIMRWDKRERIA
jgi:RNA polymerase sigma-70 factor (ECF subfamily)